MCIEKVVNAEISIPLTTWQREFPFLCYYLLFEFICDRLVLIHDRVLLRFSCIRYRAWLVLAQYYYERQLEDACWPAKPDQPYIPTIRLLLNFSVQVHAGVRSSSARVDTSASQPDNYFIPRGHVTLYLNLIGVQQ